MDIAAIPDMTLNECLQLVGQHFDVHALAEETIDQRSVLEYYRQSDRGYRLFHSSEGALHVALNREDSFTTDGYLGQVELIRDRLCRRQPQQVLEIGCGFGYNARHLAEHLPDSHLVGIDLSENHIKGAQEKSKSLNNVEFEVGDFERLRFADESFDAVFAVECLCQASDMQAAMREAHRVLKPSGQLIVIDCFRNCALNGHDEDLLLAVRLVEKTMAVHEFIPLSSWLEDAEAIGFHQRDCRDLSADISHNVARFYSLSRRFFKLPGAARVFLKTFPQRLLENSISGLLMPFTVGSGAHRYCLCELQRN